MIESRGAVRRTLSVSAGGALCAALCSFGGATGTGGAEATTPALEWSVSADGKHLAVSAQRGRANQYDAWLVRIESGALRELELVERTAPQLEFDDAGRLRIYTLDPERGTPALVWTHPDSGDVLESTRDRARIRAELEPLAHGWARLDTRRVGERTLVRRVEWPAQREHFEPDSKRDVDVAVAAQAGIVFYSRRVGDQLRLVRRDLRTDDETVLVAEGRHLADWQVASDGRAVALLERGGESRARVIDAVNGSLIAGPWLGDQVEWAPGASSRCLVIASGASRRLVDILLDKQHEAGDWARFEVLGDGSIVAQIELDLVLLDAGLNEQRVLFPGASLQALSTRER